MRFASAASLSAAVNLLGGAGGGTTGAETGLLLIIGCSCLGFAPPDPLLPP